MFALDSQTTINLARNLGIYLFCNCKINLTCTVWNGKNYFQKFRKMRFLQQQWILQIWNVRCKFHTSKRCVRVANLCDQPLVVWKERRDFTCADIAEQCSRPARLGLMVAARKRHSNSSFLQRSFGNRTRMHPWQMDAVHGRYPQVGDKSEQNKSIYFH